MDESGPVSITGTGTAPSNQPNSYNCHPTFEVTYIYANDGRGGDGTRLVCRNGPAANWPIREGANVASNGILFEGEDNKWIWVSRGNIQASAPALLNEELPQNGVRLPRATNHMNNFLTCVRSRENPICHAGIGHRSVSVCHLGRDRDPLLPGSGTALGPARGTLRRGPCRGRQSPPQPRRAGSVGVWKSIRHNSVQVPRSRVGPHARPACGSAKVSTKFSVPPSASEQCGFRAPRSNFGNFGNSFTC